MNLRCWVWGHGPIAWHFLAKVPGHIYVCVNCERRLGQALEGEMHPVSITNRPPDEYWEVWSEQGADDGMGLNACTIGWFRRFTEYLQCHFMGHDCQWVREPAYRGVVEECRTCGERFRFVSDWQRRAVPA